MSKNFNELFNLLDRYLIGDLESMSKIVPIPILQDYDGKVGYPMLQTILSGMELLGMIISGKDKRNAFYDFWKEFVKDNESYKNFEKVFIESVRNGIAHHFLTKNKITVSKYGREDLNLRIDGENLNIDVLVVYRDFSRTYFRIRKEILSGEKNIPEKFLLKIENSFKKGETYIKELVDSLPKLNQSSSVQIDNNSSIPSDLSGATHGYLAPLPRIDPPLPPNHY